MTDSKRSSIFLLVVAAVFAVVLPAAGATSQTGNRTHAVVHVSYADLNLSSDAGISALYWRLRGATKAVCGEQHSLRDAGSLEQLLKNRQCYDAVLSDAVARIDNSKLDRIHSG